MKNYVQVGDTITATSPRNVASGEGALIGSLFGVAAGAYLSGDIKAEFKTTGVFILPKNSAEAWTVGVRVYWDNTNFRCTTTASGNTLIGCALEAAANPSATGVVRLNGVA